MEEEHDGVVSWVRSERERERREGREREKGEEIEGVFIFYFFNYKTIFFYLFKYFINLKLRVI